MKRLRLILLLPLLTACVSAPADPFLRCGSAGPDTYYFPEGTFAPYVPPPRPGYRYLQHPTEHDSRSRESYSLTMDFLELPSLTCDVPRADETYRLVWIRSFHPVVAIQIDRSGDHYTLDVTTPHETRLSGKPLQRIHRELTKGDLSRITAGLQTIDFWKLPPNDQESGNFVEEGKEDQVLVRTSGKDGANWIIEGRGNRYHVIDRWSDADDVIAVGRIFIELAQLVIPEEDIY